MNRTAFPVFIAVIFALGCSMTAEEMKKGIHAAGDAKLVAKILKQDKEYATDISDDKNKTPLHTATTPEVAQLLIDHGADVNAMDAELNTPLHLAKTAAMVNLLLDKGADINASNVNLAKPIETAANPEVIKALVGRGAKLNVDPKAVFRAAGGGQAALLDILLANGGDANARTGSGKYGDTLLHVAAKNDRPEVIKILLKHGADVDARASYDATPLHHAAMNGKVDAARALLDGGANINAELSGNVAVQRFDPNRIKGFMRPDQDAGGGTPLKIAADPGMRGLLKERGGR
ncbi:MAG: ankyrin repeat domain-containing protein [Elusimicrobiota bacterium]